MAIKALPLPSGRAPSLKLDRDAVIKRALIVIIALYLIVSLALPLYTMLSKSFVTYSFDLAQYEIQISDENGQNFGPVQTLAQLNAAGKALDLDAIPGGNMARLSAPDLLSDFSFRSAVIYRLRSASDQGIWQEGAKKVHSAEWIDYSARDFRRIALQPVPTRSLQNYVDYFTNPALAGSIGNSLKVALISTVMTVGLAFGFAYALSRSCMRFKGTMRLIAMMPILVPSLLPGIALIYLFGNQGLLKGLLLGQSIYGPLGIVMGSIFFTFPHAFLIISTALNMADQRQYEAAQSLRSTPWRTFWTVTVPGARYGLISAAFVTFTLVITDFGLPKVIGGQFNVLAVDIYKQVIGQQNFEMGAVVSTILLLPAVLAFVTDRYIQKKQVSQLSSRAVPYSPKPNASFDGLCLLGCALIAGFILAIILTCQLASVVSYWPYDMSFSLKNFAFDKMDGGGWAAYGNSLKLAAITSLIGTAIVFIGAYAVEKINDFGLGRGIFQFLAMLPMAVPGMVLGLSYIFFFNNPDNPLHGIYGTMTILVVSTVTHFYTVGHLTALTALKQIDPEYEAVAASMRQPFYRLFSRVTVPICLPAILDIGVYMFVNAMTTVSAVVFIYSTHTALASVAVLNMDDAGDIAPAAAMGMLIFYTNVAARGIYTLLSRQLLTHTQHWR